MASLFAGVGKAAVTAGKTVGKAAVTGGKIAVKAGKTVASKTVATAKSAGKIAVKTEKSVQHSLAASAKSVKRAIHKRTEDTSQDEARSEDATDLTAEKTGVPEKETGAPEKETGAPEKERDTRVETTSGFPYEDGMHDGDDMNVDEENAGHNEDEFNDFFGQGAFDQQAFDTHFPITGYGPSGVLDPRIKLLAFPPQYLQAMGVNFNEIPGSFGTSAGGNPAPSAYNQARALSTDNAAPAQSMTGHARLQKGAGGERVGKKCHCNLSTFVAKPLIIRTLTATDAEKVLDQQLLIDLRAQGFSTMKECACTGSKNKYICCDVCPENFSQHCQGQADCDNKKQSLMASSPVDKKKAVLGGDFRAGKIVKGHSGTKSHVFWRVAAAMHRILPEIQAAEANPQVRDRQNWSQHIPVESLWTRQHWTDSNWMSCCNLLISQINDFKRWQYAYNVGIPGVFEDKSSKITQTFHNAERVLSAIVEHKFLVPGGFLPPGTLPDGYSTTDS